MRVAMVSRNAADEPVLQTTLPETDHEILHFNIDRARRPDEPILGSYAEIAALFPLGWKPDVFLHWSLEYNPVLAGIEEADCLTVATIGDWNLGGQAFQQMGGAFDMLFADRSGGARLRQAGFPNVYYVPLWSYDPSLHRLLPDIERDLDIVMVGSFNHEVQRERAPWLARVAKLSHKRRVCLTSGVYGEDYTRLLNRAKIVFNRSIRGEINMRVYEAMACGALLFYERENLEIHDLFTDGEDCVLYGGDDLEDLLDYYLSRDAERERIAEAGRRKVQPYVFSHIYKRILAIVQTERDTALRVPNDTPPQPSPCEGEGEELAPSLRRRGLGEVVSGALHCSHRSFLSLPSEERDYRRACQYLVMPHRRCAAAAHAILSRLPERSEVLNASVCAQAEFASAQTDGETQRQWLHQAVETARYVLERQPGYIAARFNLAQIHLARSRPGAAMKLLREVAQALQNMPLRPEQLRGPYFPRQSDLFLVEQERIWATCRSETQEWTEALRRLLLWRVLEQASDLAFQERQFEQAAAYAAEAVALQPEWDRTRRRYAKALRSLGRFADAEAEYRRAWEANPFSPELWNELATLLLETKRVDECRLFLQETEVLIDGCPFYETWRTTLRALHSLLRSSLQAEQAVAPLRLLALPDWNEPEQWGSLLRAYVQGYPLGSPVHLLLSVLSPQHPPVEAVCAEIECFLRDELHTAPDAIADISLLTEPIDVLFAQADALLLLGSAEEAKCVASGLPTLSWERLAVVQKLIALSTTD